MICWRWKPHKGYRSTFSPETVNTLFRMVERCYPRPLRHICVTDDPQGIDASVEIVPLWTEFAHIPPPQGPKQPSCYRRLRLFDPEIGAVFGRRYVSLDLDMVITGDLTSIWDRSEDIVLYGNTNKQTLYNGSMMLMTAGARPHVWQWFHPILSPMETVKAKQFGSDQGWISHVLGPGEAMWTQADGVYSYRNDLRRNPDVLPSDAKVVIFHGAHDPWGDVAQRFAWVRRFYC